MTSIRRIPKGLSIEGHHYHEMIVNLDRLILLEEQKLKLLKDHRTSIAQHFSRLGNKL